MELITRMKVTKEIEWRTLLGLCVAGDLAILLYMVIVSGDSLALGLGVLFLIALGLMQFRGGTIGVVMAGVLSADIALWTTSGAVSNFANGEALSALILPAYLGLFSLAGVASAVATVVTRKDPARGVRKATVFSRTLLALFLLITIAGLLVPKTATLSARSSDVALVTKGMQFSDAALVSDEGEISLRLSNKDLWWHTFTIDELDVNLAVPMGAERSLSFSAPAGIYDFYCAIPGHEAAGMSGTITVGQ